MKSRRDFLRLAGTLAVGVGVFLISDALVGTQFLQNDAEGLEASFVVTSGTTNSRASLITVKVYYTLMAQYTDLTEEDFVLQSPATLQDLTKTVVIRHPSMAQMMSTMLTLLDGAPSKPNASLSDGDTVQFIPLIGGG